MKTRHQKSRISRPIGSSSTGGELVNGANIPNGRALSPEIVRCGSRPASERPKTPKPTLYRTVFVSDASVRVQAVWNASRSSIFRREPIRRKSYTINCSRGGPHRVLCDVTLRERHEASAAVPSLAATLALLRSPIAAKLTAVKRSISVKRRGVARDRRLMGETSSPPGLLASACRIVHPAP